MDKPKMKYRVAYGHNLKGGNPIKRPVVTDRETLSLKQLVAYAKTAGYMRGQQKDLEGLAGGLLEAAKDRALEGYSLNFNDWFIISGQIKGQVDDTLQLNSANSYHITITASKDMKVGIDNFDWTRVDDSGIIVKVDNLTSPGGKQGEITKGKAIVATGRNLAFNAALGDTVTVTWKVDEEERSLALTPVEQSDTYLRFDWPEGLNNVDSGTHLTFTFRTRAGIAGGGEQVNEKAVTLIDA